MQQSTRTRSDMIRNRMAGWFRYLSWGTIRSFVTRGTDLKRLPVVKLLILAAGIVSFVLWAAIEQRSSTIVEWLLNPDHAINFTADWRGDQPYGVAVTIIDIDNSSFEAWGRPAWTPRTKLFDLIDTIDRHGATAIVVDVDLTSGPTTEELNVATQRILDYLARPRPAGAIPAPLIFVRKLWARPRTDGALRSVQVPTHDVIDTDRTYADALDRLNDTVDENRSPESAQTIWASALFDTESSGTIRFWQILEAACDNGAVRGFPSVGLATAALLADGSSAIADLRRDVNIYAARYCGSQNVATAHDNALPDRMDAVMPWLKLRRPTTRLPFLFWSASLEPFRFGTARTSTGSVAPLLEILSADAVLKRGARPMSSGGNDVCDGTRATTALSCSLIAGRIVTIGASHIDSSDTYFTPLGSMPGVYILANTVAGARDTLLRTPSWYQRSTLWAVILFVTFVILVSRLRAIFAIIGAMLITIVFLTSVSSWIGISTTNTYHSINAAIVMLAIFLTTSSFFVKFENWLRNGLAWVAAKVR